MKMDHRFDRFILLTFSLLILNGCGVAKKTETTEQTKREDPRLNSGVHSTPHALVYKTRADYFNRVPVLLNAAKDRIVSYPDPIDLYEGSTPTLPTRLKNGYLLDNRGIGANVAFLTYTYEKYGALKKLPELDQLMDSLLDRNPLTELWDCGSRSLLKKEVEELNALIDNGFPNCKKSQP